MISPVSYIHTAAELSCFAQRLLAASSIGIYISQENGHRYINIDVRELCSVAPDALHHKDFHSSVLPDSSAEPLYTIKEYGSFATCLNRIDEYLWPNTLIDIYKSLNIHNDNNVFVGTSRVE